MNKIDVGIVSSFLAEGVTPDQLSVADAIFIFGHYDPAVAHHALTLWNKGLASKIVISGKGRDRIPKGFETEADHYAQILYDGLVPRSALILERWATNTLENVVFGVQTCHNDGFYPNSLILCALSPLLRRSCATFCKQFPHIEVCGSPFILPEDWFTNARVKRLLGEFDRFDDYYDKGDISKVVIPDDVRDAVLRLRAFH